MEELIPIVNKLQDVFSAVGQNPINLPQIVVIGSQSSGKSSVLENLVGRDFLPRGTGIVTRRPLVLQLYNTGVARGGRELPPTPLCKVNGGIANSPPSSPKSPISEKEWGEFLHLPGKKIYNFMDIKKEIMKETERLTGTNSGISNQTIHLRIFSPKVLTLTLVDLPGMTKVAVGDQPSDIEQKIRDMCLRYVSNPNAIILSVTAANTDLANSDAIQMAREVDPEGDRTIGVLTKLDLMDPGTDASETLMNRTIPLKRGYVGIMNRGQKDIVDGVSIRHALTKEEKFFKEHPSYRVLQHRLGTSVLAKTLNQILIHHIRDCLPEIKAKLNGMMLRIQQELVELGSTTEGLNGSTLGATMLTLLSKFASNFQAIVDGKGSSPDGQEMNELYGGARISYIFHEMFAQSLSGIDPFDGLTDRDICTAIYNANGTRPSLFVPEMSFDLLVRRQIARLEQPGLQCADLVFDEMQRMAIQCEGMDLMRFPALKDAVIEVVHSVLRNCMEPTQNMICNLIKVELGYINTNHPDFIGGSRAVAQLVECEGSGKPSRAPRPLSPLMSAPNQRAGANAASSSGSFSSHSKSGMNDTKSQSQSSSRTVNGEGGSSSGKGNGGLMSFIFGGQNDDKPRQVTSPVKLPQVPDTVRQSVEPTDREKIELQIIKNLIKSYFNIVRENFQDLVPKTIMHFLVNESSRKLQNSLVSSLYKEERIPSLMKETDDIAERRKIAREMHNLLEKAMDILHEVRTAPLG